MICHIPHLPPHNDEVRFHLMPDADIVTQTQHSSHDEGIYAALGNGKAVIAQLT